MAQGFIARVGGKFKQVFAIVTSAGAADSGKIPGLDATGKLDASFLPTGIGANSVPAIASEAIAAGKFVNLFDNAGVLGMRLADNSNNREAWGYVTAAVASGASGTAYRLNTVNANLTGLTPGASYWLGTAGGTIAAPLDPVTGVGKTDQFLGIAKSATELVTSELDAVLL
ncbi:hypothetical protein GOD54_23615 [Sinorhizobium medicae]|nr:hypothetical protein [Sinorhizobium medicae]